MAGYWPSILVLWIWKHSLQNSKGFDQGIYQQGGYPVVTSRNFVGSVGRAG